MLVKTPQLISTALAHVFQTEKLLVTDFLLFSVCACMCVFIAKSGIPLNACVSLKTSHVFNSTNSPLCGCGGMCLSFRVERMVNKMPPPGSYCSKAKV